ncbi:MAG: hypothetical protein HZA54_10295 [Planctomycetes bacterium]|nr:hypothetical protein [Planctomycetota bacterium]
MIGTVVESGVGLPFGSIFWAAVALAQLLGAALLQNHHLALGAIFPATLAVSLRFLGRTRCRFTLGASGFEFSDPADILAYTRMLGAWAPRRPADPDRAAHAQFDLHVLHDRGHLLIPSTTTTPSEEIYRFLQARIPPSGTREINPTLRGYLEEQVRKYGAERVFSYGVRRVQGRIARLRRSFALAATASLTASGLFWLLVPFVTGAPEWRIAGGLSLFLAVLLLAIGLQADVAASPLTNALRPPALVVSPGGIALIQGALSGTMTWDEVKSVSPRLPMVNYSTVVFELSGATIVLQDVFDRPPDVIYQSILQVCPSI